MPKVKVSSVFLLYLMVLAPVMEAQTKKEIVAEMQEAIGRYKNFGLAYQLDFKSQAGNDTNTKINTGVFMADEKMPVIGYVKIIDGDSFDYKVAYNRQELVILDKEGIYAQGNIKAHAYWYRTRIEDNFYRPFLLKNDFYKNFILTGTDSRFYFLTRIDTTEGLVDYKTIISVAKNNFLPVEMEEWNWFDGGVQYRRSVLLEIENIPAKRAKMIPRQTDSLIWLYKTFMNGDSMYEARMALYRQLKPGDSARNFTGHIHGTSDSVEINHLKDSIIILDFSYTTCGPCRAAIPGLNAINILYRDRGVKMYTVNHMAHDWPKLDKFAEYFQPNFQVLKVDQRVAFDYGIQRYPTFVIIKNGVVMFIKYGSADLENILKQEIDKLL